MAALTGHAADLVCHQASIPNRRECEGNEATWMTAAPLVDMPVVVRLQHDEGESLVLMPRECRAAEAGERREAHGGQNTVRIHVEDPRISVVTSRAELVEARGFHPVLVGRPTSDGIESDIRDLLSLPRPYIGTVGLAHDVGSAIAKSRRDVTRKQVGRLDDVVVDAHEDEIIKLQGAPPWPREPH